MESREDPFWGPGPKVAVTGSNGFVGNFLVSELQGRQIDVMTLDIKQGCDISNWDTLQGINLQDVKVVYHLAARLYVPDSFNDPWLFYQTNVIGTLNLLRLCRRYNVEKIIFMSSYVYGPPDSLPISEIHPVNPTNPYAVTKLLGENLCRFFQEEFGLRCIIFRLFNIYGPGQSGNFLIPKILNQLSQHEISLFDSEPKRDYLYVTDAVRALLKAASYDEEHWQIFNLGSGMSYSINDIVNIILRLAKKHRVKVNYMGRRREGEIMETKADIRRAIRHLDWKPLISLNRGLEHCLAAIDGEHYQILK